MRIILIFFITLHLFPNFQISYGDSPTGNYAYQYSHFNTTVVPGLTPELSFDSTLKKILTVTEDFGKKLVDSFVELSLGLIGEFIGPAAAFLPILQSQLIEQDDHFHSDILKAIKTANEKTELNQARNLLRDINRDVKRFRMFLEKLNKLMEGRNKSEKISDLTDMIGTSIVSIIQNDIEDRVTEMSEGNSIFWKFPDLAAQAILALSSFIGIFSPIRDVIYGNLVDNSIISCIMAENINAYIPSIRYWRLQQVYNPGIDKDDPYMKELIFNIAFLTQELENKIRGYYDWSSRKQFIRCDEGSEAFIKFADKLQNGEVFGIHIHATGNYNEDFWKCFTDYLTMLRWKTEIHSMKQNK